MRARATTCRKRGSGWSKHGFEGITFACDSVEHQSLTCIIDMCQRAPSSGVLDASYPTSCAICVDIEISVSSPAFMNACCGQQSISNLFTACS